MWDLAKQFDALLLFAEHRYYGASMPFGNDSFSVCMHIQPFRSTLLLLNLIYFQTPEKAGYLTSSQALADFADFLTWYRKNEKAEKSPIIAFGGSYGGMLTAWMRMKYPHIIQGY